MPINTEYISGQLLNHDATTSQNLGKMGDSQPFYFWSEFQTVVKFDLINSISV
jgi:hypothetical protein